MIALLQTVGEWGLHGSVSSPTGSSTTGLALLLYFSYEAGTLKSNLQWNVQVVVEGSEKLTQILSADAV